VSSDKGSSNDEGADNCMVSLHTTGFSGRWIAKSETKFSRLEDADIFGNGANDYIGLYVSLDLGCPNDEVLITVMCLRIPPDSWVAG